MSLISEFKEFAMRGNVVDLAVGVVIGAAFGKITASMVEDIFNPILGMVLGKVDFSNLYLNLSGQEYPTLAEAQKAGAAVIRYGVFINTLINFLIVAMAMFLVVKAMNQLRREPPAPPPPAEPPAEEKLLTEIRDLLKQNAKT